MANFKIPRGSDWSVEVEFNDAAGADISGVGATAAVLIRSKFFEVEITPVTSGWKSPASEGVLILSLDEAASALIPAGRQCEIVATVVRSGQTSIHVLGDVEGV